MGKNIKGFALVNGMEIIGIVADNIDSDANSISLEKVVVVGIAADPSGKKALGFGPVSYIASSSSIQTNQNYNLEYCDIVLQKTAIVFEYELKNEIIKEYMSATSGIILP